jgi:adenylyltransferase/sulfurtransferase
VLGVLPGMIGMIQATETIKLILGIGEPLIGRFVIYDALRMRFRELKLRKDPDCPVCGTNPSIRELRELAQYCTPIRQHDEDTVSSDDISVTELKARMDAGTPPRIIDVREPHEYQICSIPGAQLIPAAQLTSRLSEYDPLEEVVVHCRSGVRSAQAVMMMRERGFHHARNLKGGVLAWVDEVDPSQPKY